MSTELTEKEIVLLSHFPPREISAIYFLISGDEIVYIGKTIDFAYRMRTHQRQNRIKFEKCFYLGCPINKLKKFEREMILKYRPKYNKELYLKKAIREEAENINMDDLFFLSEGIK